MGPTFPQRQFDRLQSEEGFTYGFHLLEKNLQHPMLVWLILLKKQETSMYISKIKIYIIEQ